MDRYKYRAINETGRPVRGTIAALNEVDLYKQLQSAGLELIDCKKHSEKSLLGFNPAQLHKVKVRDMIQFFVHMEQMQGAGVSMLDGLADIRDSTENPRMRDVMSEIYRDVSDGGSLSEGMAKHPKIFSNIIVSLIQAGEDTGDLLNVYRQLVKYLKWVDDMQSKIRKAIRYPIIVTIVVLLVVVIMMGYVVPQIIGFLENMEQELNIFTIALIATTDFFSQPAFHIFGLPVYGGLIVLLTPFIIVASILSLRRMSYNIAYRIDMMLLSMPIAGDLIRKITIARYSQTFSALFSSGIDIVKGLKSARKTVNNVALIEALDMVEQSVQAGDSLSQAFNNCGEFPSLVVRMIKVGEESGNLSKVLDQVSEFYTRDVDEAVQGLITMIEPMLTAVLGTMILWIAVAVFGPIYSMIENLEI